MQINRNRLARVSVLLQRLMVSFSVVLTVIWGAWGAFLGVVRARSDRTHRCRGAHPAEEGPLWLTGASALAEAQGGRVLLTSCSLHHHTL